MSMKKKLSLTMAGSLCLILLLNIILSLYTTQASLRRESERKMLLAARQVAASIEQSQESAGMVERQIGELLHVAAKLAAKELDPDIQNITNEQLAKLSKQVGVTHIALLVRTGDDIIIAKSSEPAERGLSTKDWGYWYRAFKQLFEEERVTIPYGAAADHFWTGPFEYSNSKPNVIDKWGYYYDAKRNYIIDPYIRTDSLHQIGTHIPSPEEVLDKTKKINGEILEISCINPQTFAGVRMSGQGYVHDKTKLHNRPIRYGTYTYIDLENDKQAVEKAAQTGANVVYETRIDGKKLLKSFIPVNSASQASYIISIVMDYAQISKVLQKQLVSYISISAFLLILFVIVSYKQAGYFIRPIDAILGKVKNVAQGRFDTPLVINSKDELGLLAAKINTMTDNLSSYTDQLKQAVEENRSVKEHLESVIQQTADAIHTTDLEGNIIQVNQAFEKLYGWASHEVIGKRINLIPGHLEGEVQARLDALMQGEQLPAVETVRIKKDGTPVEVSISTSAVRDPEGKVVSFISISRDMTERNRMDELLRRSEKLTTVGQLAAGVAHEIRNPLTTLRGFLQLQEYNNRVDPKHNQIMLSELERINLIVSEFLILAKPQAVHFRNKNVRDILEDVLSLLSSQANLHGIEFVMSSQTAETDVHCEENQLKQVFINLLKNAMEAMPEGGVIRIDLFRPDPDHLGITITDEGVGIPEHQMEKVGEPFFTNKENGTGLGLMVSQRIVEGHKGSLQIKSAVNKGTQVTLTLPAARPEHGEGPERE